MRISLLLLLCVLFSSPAMAQAKKYMGPDGKCHECPEVIKTDPDPGCVTCPQSGFQTGPGSGRALPGSSAAGGAFFPQSFSGLPNQIKRPSEAGLTQQSTPSFLFRLVGDVKSVNPEHNEVTIQPKRSRKNQTVYVFDPVLNRLKEDSVVEVWLKPGSSTAEKIKQIS